MFCAQAANVQARVQSLSGRCLAVHKQLSPPPQGKPSGIYKTGAWQIVPELVETVA